MVEQYEILLPPYARGFHIIDEHINKVLQRSRIQTGIIHIFIKHTSAALAINEGADPDVRTDLETIFNFLVPENRKEYKHNSEGSDDMPAHAKAILAGASLTIPLTKGKSNLGTWQSIYLCEFRNHASGRKLVITIYGETQ